MNMVRRAIIVAAGQGTRMKPVTLNTPKPLVKVNGVRMIETVIHALRQNKIEEIHVVVGYLKEQFQVLKDVDIIENPFYETCNNISSLYVARDYLEDSIILDGDQIIFNAGILSPEFEHSGYNAVWTEDKTTEWLMQVENGIVSSCSRTGGEKGWKLFSISRWSAADGRKLKKHLEIEFEEKQNRQIYWDDIAMFLYPKDYTLGIKEMSDEDVIEIDSFQELLEIDPSYKNFKEIAYNANCEKKD